MQGATAVSFGIIALGAVVVTFHPNLLSKIRLQCGHHALLQVAKVLLVCCLFMVAGPSLMILNKDRKVVNRLPH